MKNTQSLCLHFLFCLQTEKANKETKCCIQALLSSIDFPFLPRTKMTTATDESIPKLSTDSSLIEIQGVTLDRSHIRVLGIYAFLSIVPTVLFYFWPQAGGIALLVFLYSAQKEIRGKQGWMRTFLLKHCGKNIISWFPERLPSHPNTLPEPAPSIVIALPHNVHEIEVWPQFGIVVCTMSCALLPLSIYIEQPIILAWAAGFFLVTTIICFALPGPAVKPAEDCIKQHNQILKSWQSEKRNHRLAIVLYEDGVNGGGIPTFLQNYEDFIPANQTRLFFVEQSENNQYFVPKGLFGKLSTSSVPAEVIANPQGKTHTMFSAHAYGWNSALVQTPFNKENLEKLFAQMDSEPSGITTTKP